MIQRVIELLGLIGIYLSNQGSEPVTVEQFNTAVLRKEPCLPREPAARHD
jgi:hypothetical protein